MNDLQLAYNGFGQLTSDYQEHGGAVNLSMTPEVAYGYADGSANTIRPTTMTYRNGRVLTFDYGASQSPADAASRVNALIDNDGTTQLVAYSYLGAGAFVIANSPQPNVQYTLIGTAGGNDPVTGDIYRGLDLFGRIKDSYWYNTGTATDADRIQYGYDRASNRTFRQNTVAESLTAEFDELYQGGKKRHPYCLAISARIGPKDRVRCNSWTSGASQYLFGFDATGRFRRRLGTPPIESRASATGGRQPGGELRGRRTECGRGGAFAARAERGLATRSKRAAGKRQHRPVPRVLPCRS